MWVRIPLETYIFILNFSLPPRSEQINRAVANEIKHVHSPEVIVVLDPRYDLSYKALYISTCSIALSDSGVVVKFWDLEFEQTLATKISEIGYLLFLSHGMTEIMLNRCFTAAAQIAYPNKFTTFPKKLIKYLHNLIEI